MTVKLPYLSSPGLIPKILDKIEAARRPDRFTQDFLGTKLGFPSGSARAFIPFLKRMGFLASDGTPTELYDKFRNTDTQGFAIAQGMKNAYSELFDRNEYVYEMPAQKLKSLISEITGAAKDDRTVQLTVSAFSALNKIADFEASSSARKAEESSEARTPAVPPSGTDERGVPSIPESVDLRIGYTINLNLPESTNPEVFAAIFQALRENLLKE